jgi:hypothetical protein
MLPQYHELHADKTGKPPGAVEIIDLPELARRLKVPTSWAYAQTRARVPKAQRLPVLALGRYRRVEWGSPQLEAWLSAHRVGGGQ